MKVNIIGNGSIGAKYMSASTLLDDHVLVDVPYRNCYTSNLEKSIVIAIFNSKNVVNVNHLSTKILCG